MLTIIIGVIAFAAIYPAAANGEWGSVAVGAVILLILMLMSHEERKDTKAFMNFRDYWAEGGPDRKR